MEMIRWVLVLTGILLLGAAYLVGRKTPSTANVYNRAVPKSYDPAVDELSVPISDPLLDDAPGMTGQAESHAPYNPERRAHIQEPIQDSYHDALNVTDDDAFADESDLQRKTTSFAGAVKQAQAQDLAAEEATDQFAPLDDNFYAEEFEVYGEPVQIEEFEEKLVTIHVAASPDRRFYGKDIKSLFDKHGYQFGHMSLYHCMLENDRVFSIANMVKPGTFNEQEMESFETPGVTLFMRLPIELDSDVAFDFLVREARELASELGGHLRDSNRNPLSEQTIQHMREDVQQYVFRTRRSLQPS